jgi:hypothetical protein
LRNYRSVFPGWFWLVHPVLSTRKWLSGSQPFFVSWLTRNSEIYLISLRHTFQKKIVKLLLVFQKFQQIERFFKSITAHLEISRILKAEKHCFKTFIIWIWVKKRMKKVPATKKLIEFDGFEPVYKSFKKFKTLFDLIFKKCSFILLVFSLSVTILIWKTIGLVLLRWFKRFT